LPSASLSRPVCVCVHCSGAPRLKIHHKHITRHTGELAVSPLHYLIRENSTTNRVIH
jgi:hypothetical protein